MATQLDLQEQEQLDTLKAFWKQYGNLLTWTVIVALAAFAGWNGWNYWQREQGFKAGALYDELDRAAAAGDTDKTQRVLTDLQARHAKTSFAEQGALLAARLQFDKGQLDAAAASLQWLADKGTQEETRTIARLRLAALLASQQKYDEALKVLDAATTAGFEPLVADRRGDVLLAQNKPAEARTAYQAAFAGLAPTVDYRRVVEAKLTALGAPPVPVVEAAASAAASGASK